MSLHFEPIWPWPLTIIASLAMLLVVALAYPRQISHLTVSWRRTLVMLRLLVVLLLILLMLRPAAIFRQQDRSDSILYVLLDASRSMQTTDTAGGVSRRASVLQTLESAAAHLKSLGEKSEVRIRDFSDSVLPVTSPTVEADGRMTAIGAALQQIAEEAGRTRVAGVLILSDGRQAASGSLDVDPAEAARLLGRQQRPLYTVVYGSSESVDAGQDLALEELDLARDVFRGNVVPIRVKLKAFGAQGQPVRVRAMVEDRSNRLPGEAGEMKPAATSDEVVAVVEHTPTASAEEVTLQLRIVPDTVGDIKIALEADALPGEIRRTNNRIETIIRVRQGGIRVAYFDVLRPEQKWLRRINVSNRVQLDFQLIRTGSFLGQNAIPDSFFEVGNYDAFIIGNVPSSAFHPRQLAALQQCCLKGAGLMMTGGFENFGAGGYDRTPLASLLPIQMGPDDTQLSEPQKMLPTRDGLQHYVMQIAPVDQNRARWEQLPALSGANLLKQRDQSAAQVLAASADGTPLLIGQSLGLSRVLAFAGDTTWQWAMQGFEEEHQRFWRQIIFWLTKKEIDSEQKVWVNVEPRDLTIGQTAQLTIGARDDEGNPRMDVQFEAEVRTPNRETVKLTTRRTESGAVADFAETSESGDYWVQVRALKEGQPIDGAAITRFNVGTRDPELDYPTADPSLMRELAHLSGGDYLSPEELISRLSDWASRGLPGMELERTERTSLWDNWLMLLLIVMLLAVEWTIRKKRGLV